MSDDIIGTALLDFFYDKDPENIRTYSSLEEEDELPIAYLFRDAKEMPILEKKALKLCYGRILDIGCGSGSHSLYLQNKGMEVTALDSSLGAIEVCKARGIENVICKSILDYSGPKFDTLLLLMNGIGLANNMNGLGSFLNHLKSLLTDKGQILLDSSDIIYMFEQDDDGGFWVPNTGDYYGEVVFTMSYKGKTSESFPWLYIDYNSLNEIASLFGLNCELLAKGEHYDYLARLSLKDTI